jgi:ABC-type transport system involved in multi-copper enzyme maturation permease subunit
VSDPITSPVEFWFFVFALLVMVWVALDTRSFVKLALLYSKPVPEWRIHLLKVLSAFCAFGVVVLLLCHLVHSH